MVTRVAEERVCHSEGQCKPGTCVRGNDFYTSRVFHRIPMILDFRIHFPNVTTCLCMSEGSRGYPFLK